MGVSVSVDVGVLRFFSVTLWIMGMEQERLIYLLAWAIEKSIAILNSFNIFGFGFGFRFGLRFVFCCIIAVICFTAIIPNI